MRSPWPLIPLGDMLTERQETPLPAALIRGEIPIVAKVGFEDGQIQLRNTTDTKTGMILIRPGDLVVSGINAAKGAIAIYGTENEKPIAATIHYGAYIPNPKHVDAIFLWWLLRSRTFRESLAEYLPGGIKTELKAKRLLPVPIPLPRLSEQRRIVARIEQFAAKIQEARHLRQRTTEEATALMSAAMREGFRLGQGFEEVHLETICAEIIDNLHSNPIYADDGVPCVRSPDVGWGELHLDTALRTTEEEFIRRTVRGEPRLNDIVLVREGGGTGKAAIVKERQRFSLGQRVMMLRPDQEKVYPSFLLYQILSPTIYEDQILPLSKGSASPHLNIGALRKFKFLLPSLTEQLRIVAYLDGLQAKVDALKKFQAETAAELDALLPSILDRAFRGELVGAVREPPLQPKGADTLKQREAGSMA